MPGGDLGRRRFCHMLPIGQLRRHIAHESLGFRSSPPAGPRGHALQARPTLLRSQVEPGTERWRDLPNQSFGLRSSCIELTAHSRSSKILK